MPGAGLKHIRVLLVQEQALVRAGLRVVLERRAGIEVVAEADNNTDALQSAAREQPDIILLDPDLHNGRGLELIPQLLEVARHARVIALTAHHDNHLHHQAIRLGARGLVLKDHSAELLLKAVEKVHLGEVWIDRSMMATILHELSLNGRSKQQRTEQEQIKSLTDREREVVTLICEGLQNRAIGKQLSISEPTVRHHLTSIFDKLGIANRLELVIYAYRHGLVKPDRRS